MKRLLIATALILATATGSFARDYDCSDYLLYEAVFLKAPNVASNFFETLSSDRRSDLAACQTMRMLEMGAAIEKKEIQKNSAVRTTRKSVIAAQ
jgi:hypothetical protein